MMNAVILLMFAAPAYAMLEPYADEEAAAHAFEAHIYCLAERAMERRDDIREPGVIAAEVVNACSDRAATLRAALVDVYRRRPQLIGADGNAEEAADYYLSGARERAEVAIREGRKHK